MHLGKLILMTNKTNKKKMVWDPVVLPRSYQSRFWIRGVFAENNPTDYS